MVVRELAGELRDEGGRRAREKKKKLRKKEERREVRERERKGKEYFNGRGERSVINFFIFFLALSYSTHLKTDVYNS